MKQTIVTIWLTLGIGPSIAVSFLGKRSAIVAVVNTHPIEQTIALLKELQAKVKLEGQTEEVTYAKFSTWCGTSLKSINTAIATSKESIDQLETTISAKKEAAASLQRELDSLGDELSKASAADSMAQTMRHQAAELYGTSDKELADTIDAITQALAALENAKSSTSAAELVQIVEAKPLVLEELMAHQPELKAAGDYDSHTKKYNFKSSNIIELLKSLKQKFEDDRVENTKAETNSLNAHSLATVARKSAIDAATLAQGEKTTLLGETNGQIASAVSALQNTKDNLEADTASLDATSKSCNMKNSEWTERSKIRSHELEAMAAAIDILAKVGGVRTEAPKNPILPPSPLTTLLGLRKGLRAAISSSPVQVGPSQRAIDLLRTQARKSHSRVLSQFADELAAHLTGPFDELNNMIQKMIFRLLAEQTDEDAHKNWCDQEMGKTNISIDDKTGKITALTLKITEAQTSATLLANEADAANKMVETLTKHIAEATQIREAGKDENKAAIADAKKAQVALAEAISILEAFYKQSGMMKKEAWELLEQPVQLPVEPATWDSAYTGVADPANQPTGVVTLLKSIAADFAKMEADTIAQEEIDQKAYSEEVKACEIEKTRRGKEAEMKSQEQKRLLDKVGSMEKSAKGVQTELEAAQQYYKDLGPACRDGDSTYEARKADRAAEVAALKEAQVILADAFAPASDAGSTLF